MFDFIYSIKQKSENSSYQKFGKNHPQKKKIFYQDITHVVVIFVEERL